MDVSIIIVNYNTKELLYDCINSIYDKTQGVSFEIIVVDNASTDGSREFINSNFKDLIWIQSDVNLGFGAANNLGAKHALGKYLFLLNSDTYLLNDAITEFYNYKIQNDSIDNNIGVLGCQLVDREGCPNTAAGNLISPFNNRVITPVDGFKKVTEVGYVMGADMFLSKEVFDSVGGFDEDFFMYCEEVDLQKRISELNRKNYIVTTPRIVHLEGASFKGTSKNLSFTKYIMWQKSRNIYAAKHFKGLKMLFWKLEMALFNPRIIFRTNWSIKEKITAYRFSLH